MTDQHQETVASGASTDEKEHVIVIPVSAVKRARGLSGGQYDLWLYLYVLDRYGKGIEVPPPEDIGKELGCHARTVFRNSQRLTDRELFEFEIKRWKAYNVRARAYFSKNSLGKEIHLPTKGSKGQTFRSQNGHFDPERSLEEASSKGSENGNVPNRSKGNIETNKQSPTHHPVSEPNEQEGDLVLSEVLLQVEKTGIRLNKTIRAFIEQLRRQLGDSAAAVRVRNALSAVQERQEQGKVRNAGGMLLAALREGYTANEAKQKARKKSTPPDLSLVTVAVNQALLRGDRSFAVEKLNQLWADGFKEEIRELCYTWKRDWQFAVTDEGVRDAAG
jgi:hypothetical protein